MNKVLNQTIAWTTTATLLGFAATVATTPKSGAKEQGEAREQKSGQQRGSTAVPPATTRVIKPIRLSTIPHDPSAFTQGLLLHRQTLYESTGLRGHSSLREVDLSTGKVSKIRKLPEHLFGEGLARVASELIQLTWTSGRARRYSLPGLELVHEHQYSGQGWGLCFDGELLAMSDGTATLRFRDPTTFEEVRSVQVRSGEQPVRRLNELECVGEYIYANVWGTWLIAKINKFSGFLEAWIDASGILSDQEKASLPARGVLNGIAYEPASDTFLLTGKLWPVIVRTKLESPESSK